MTPGQALRRALYGLRGRPLGGAPMLPPPPRTWAEIVEEYGSRSAVADRAGYRKGTEGRAKFLRRLRGWEQGRAPKTAPPGLFRRLRLYTPARRAAMAARRRRGARTPRTLAQVLKLIRDEGLTIFDFYGELEVPSGKKKDLDVRPRAVDKAIFIPADVLDEVGFHEYAAHREWDEAADALADAWADEYGIGRVGATWGDMQPLNLAIGDQT